MTAQERITEWAALAENATEGPWVWDEPSGEEWPSGEENLRNGAGEPVLSSWGYDADGIDGSDVDRALIAASRTAVPAMAAALTAALEIPRADVHKSDDEEWQRLMSLGYNLALEAAKEAIEAALETTP